MYFIGHSKKTVFAECQIKYTQQKKNTRQNSSLPSAFFLALGKIYISHISHISFLKVEERYIRFMNNVSTTMSDEQMNKINIVDLEKLYNFVVEKFFI